MSKQPSSAQELGDLTDRAQHALVAAKIDRRSFIGISLAAGMSLARAHASADHAELVRANQLERSKNLLSRFDYIVCGAGTAGSTLAGRLAQLTDASVLLLEAGGSDEVPSVTTPGTWFTNLGTALDWQEASVPLKSLNGRTMSMNSGKVLGGGSSINACNYMRGHKNDYEFWARATGDASWDYAHTLESFMSLEDWHGAPDPKRRGQGGAVWVQEAKDPNPCAAAMVAAAKVAGIPSFEDANGAIMEGDGGAALLNHIIQDGRRRNMPSNFLYPVMDKPNLTVLTAALVDRLVLDGQRITGVMVRYQGRSIQIDASRQVVLSAGALHTPKLLMLSGIGDEKTLKRLGIKVVKHAPEVGRNLQDHVLLGGCIWEYRNPLPLTNSAADSGFMFKTRAGLDAPDIYPVHLEIPYVSPEVGKRYGPPATCWSIGIGLLRPKSRGTVTLRSVDPDAKPLINGNYLSHHDDVQALIHGIEVSREVGNSVEMKEYAKREFVPGPLKGADMASFVRDAATTFFHASGTCRMGKDDLAVTDGQLRVKGVEGLRIADSSVMPRITTGATMAPCMLIGNHLAQLLTAAG